MLRLRSLNLMNQSVNWPLFALFISMTTTCLEVTAGKAKEIHAPSWSPLHPLLPPPPPPAGLLMLRAACSIQTQASHTQGLPINHTSFSLPPPFPVFVCVTTWPFVALF